MRPGVRNLVIAASILGASLAVYRLILTPDGLRAAGTPSPSDRAAGVDPAGRARSERTRVSALGRLAPRGEVINVGAPLGDRLARVVVSEGQAVGAGEALAYLESHRERAAERQQVSARLAEAQQRLASETAYGKAMIGEATARLRQLETVPVLEIQAQEARVRVLEAELETAQRELGRVQELRTRGAAAEKDLDRQTLAVRRSELQLSAGRAVLERLRQAGALDRSLAEAQLRTAQAALSRAQSAIELQSLREAVAQADARVEHSVIRAPMAGQILKLLSRPGEPTGTRAILQLGDTASMYAVAEVYETDVALVRPGQRAKITSSALSGALGGTVESVGRLVARNAVVDSDPAAAADRRVVEVKVLLDDSRRVTALTSLQVEVEIDVRGP